MKACCAFFFQLSDKQYEWTALAARAKLKQWRGLEQMFTAKVFKCYYSVGSTGKEFCVCGGLKYIKVV